MTSRRHDSSLSGGFVRPESISRTSRIFPLELVDRSIVFLFHHTPEEPYVVIHHDRDVLKERFFPQFKFPQATTEEERNQVKAELVRKLGCYYPPLRTELVHVDRFLPNNETAIYMASITLPEDVLARLQVPRKGKRYTMMQRHEIWAINSAFLWSLHHEAVWVFIKVCIKLLNSPVTGYFDRPFRKLLEEAIAIKKRAHLRQYGVPWVFDPHIPAAAAGS